jgi:hypothetical protein
MYVHISFNLLICMNLHQSPQYDYVRAGRTSLQKKRDNFEICLFVLWLYIMTGEELLSSIFTNGIKEKQFCLETSMY